MSTSPGWAPVVVVGGGIAEYAITHHLTHRELTAPRALDPGRRATSNSTTPTTTVRCFPDQTNQPVRT